MDNRQHSIEEERSKSCTKKEQFPTVATAECHFGSGHKMVAYGPLPNNTSAVSQSHRRNAIWQWPPCYGHHQNDIQRWPTFIIVTKAISFFKIFIHSKGHRLLHFSLMKPLFLDFHFLCDISILIFSNIKLIQY